MYNHYPKKEEKMESLNSQINHKKQKKCGRQKILKEQVIKMLINMVDIKLSISVVTLNTNDLIYQLKIRL